MSSEVSLTSDKVNEFATRIEEAARSTQEGVKFFVEPGDGMLRRALSRRHHMVFGRRGSGKSSLLSKARSDLTVDRRPIAWVDLEPFKGHAYPDLLISVLINTLQAFRAWMDSAATTPASKTKFWKKLFGRSPTRQPFDKKSSDRLIGVLDRHIAELGHQLHATDEADIKDTVTDKSSRKESVKQDIKASVGTKEIGIGASQANEWNRDSAKERQTQEAYKRSKVEFLKRHVMDYQTIFDDMAKVSAGHSYIVLDDLYHIRRNDQASVVDYLHSIAKGHSLWLKVGTIRHRTRWYVHGNPPQGMKIGDDADEINLDLTLEKYSTTKRFLTNVVTELAKSCDLDIASILTDGATERLVLASGGVARDFLGILRRSIDVAKERSGNDGGKRPKIGAEDVNIAAGEYDTTKRDEFRQDIYDEEENKLTEVFNSIRAFCLQKAESNCFLIEKDVKGPHVDAINELVDLKLLHRIRSRVTVNTTTKKGHLFEAYMLDLSQYAGSRKRRGLEVIEFWKGDTDLRLRRAKLIYRPEENEDYAVAE